MKVSKLICVSGMVFAAASTAHAQTLTGTLAQIKNAGIVTVGVRESSPPFNYSIGPGKYTGYSYEIELKILDAIKQKLNMPDLKVRELPFNSQNRIALIKNGTMNYECSSTTNNRERGQQVTFSDTIFAIGTRLLTSTKSGIKDFSDLKGKNVVTIAGSTDERLLTDLNAKQSMDMHIISMPENNQAFLAMQQGRAVAYMMDDAVLYAARASAVDPAQWVVVGTPQSFEAYGCMMQKGDTQMQQLVNEVISGMAKSGEMNKLYAKWFQQPIPPRNVTLDFPMSDTVKKAFESPNDTPFQ
ncbi:amino acid ABC transporter substrate-binding protein [Bordetella genomosp. 10]|uniref:Amino acid ABC transporter substrate-binding protein n=1 Tax=Bordetella genomosp. 10 TaxID=1416804 RepID=A0A261S2I5_9BORD|nr:transporter substrate-binding domain-containing protein [Bordetella genomosp. 10]OZI31574.1 amino acid ABC transporter substrate-binding protein [Bordetella genomosp. 10]